MIIKLLFVAYWIFKSIADLIWAIREILKEFEDREK